MLFDRASTLATPTKRCLPDQWARENRVYPESDDRPGPREPSLTPYLIPFTNAFAEGQYETIGLVCGSRMGKTEGQLDVLGHRFDQSPTPAIFVGPDKQFMLDEIEPRITRLIEGAETLRRKAAHGKRSRQFRKIIGGVSLRLLWAGSATQLSGTGGGLVLIDELDRMLGNVAGEGNPLALAKARGHTFRDRKYGITSSPKLGVVDCYVCPTSGLTFWTAMPPEDIESPIWQLWQTGTMHHWAWPCSQCETYFIPRFASLKWPDGATSTSARRDAYLECPHCGGVIVEADKADMNARGRYVAPGQSIDSDGVVHGAPPDNHVVTFWVSGLASPFVSFGERASEYIEAKASGDQNKLQTVINTGFGELFSPGGGEVPEWHEVAALKRPYKSGTLPDGVRVLTMAVDVQTSCLYYTIRGWGSHGTSWKIESGQLIGRTTELDVWDQLALLFTRPIGDLSIRLMFIDSGFRPGKPFSLPVNRVYQFCRRFPRRVYPTKGRASQDKPIILGKPDVNRKAEVAKYGLDLLWLDTDWCKSWVHERLRWEPDAPGAWFLPEDTTDDYCKQIVSEARVKSPGSSRPTWVARSRNNHFLDCEGLQAAMAHQLRVDLMRDVPVDASRAAKRAKSTKPTVSKAPPPSPTPAAAVNKPAPSPAAAKPDQARPAATRPTATGQPIDVRAARRARLAALTSRIYGP